MQWLEQISYCLPQVRRHVSDGSCAALVVMRAPQRQYASQDNKDKLCKTSPPRPKSTKFFWGAVGATVLTGAAVVYAKLVIS